MTKCKCNDPGCLECYIRREVKKMPKLKQPKKLKKKKEPPAKCGLCRRRLIPGDNGSYCMTCQYRMDNAGR